MKQVSEYLHPLLTHARQISNHIFLQATAASFKESWRLVDAVIRLSEDTYQMQVLKAHTGDKGKKRRNVRRHATVEQAEDIMYVYGCPFYSISLTHLINFAMLDSKLLSLTWTNTSTRRSRV